MDTILRVIIAIVVVWLIITYLIPLLPGPFHAIVLIILVIAVIVWLMKLGGLWF